MFGMGYQTSSRCRILIFPSMTLSFRGNWQKNSYIYCMPVCQANVSVVIHLPVTMHVFGPVNGKRTIVVCPLFYLGILVADIANNMNLDQTAPFAAIW